VTKNVVEDGEGVRVEKEVDHGAPGILLVRTGDV
jgi:hypothetical protein